MSLLAIGAPFRVCIYFALHPDARLTSGYIAEKFDVGARSVGVCLRPVVERGLLAKTVGRGRGIETVYRAGPELLRMLGKQP